MGRAERLARLAGDGRFPCPRTRRLIPVSNRGAAWSLSRLCRRAVRTADRGVLAQGRAAALAVGQRRTHLSFGEVTGHKTHQTPSVAEAEILPCGGAGTAASGGTVTEKDSEHHNGGAQDRYDRLQQQRHRRCKAGK